MYSFCSSIKLYKNYIKVFYSKNFRNPIPLEGKRRDIICDSHNSVKTPPNSEKISGYMQFHLLCEMVKKNIGQERVSLLLIRTAHHSKKSVTFFF